jgi:hypothetical protein
VLCVEGAGSLSWGIPATELKSLAPRPFHRLSTPALPSCLRRAPPLTAGRAGTDFDLRERDRMSQLRWSDGGASPSWERQTSYGSLGTVQEGSCRESRMLRWGGASPQSPRDRSKTTTS